MIYYEVILKLSNGNTETEECDSLIKAVFLIDDGFRQGLITSATITEKVDE